MDNTSSYFSRDESYYDILGVKYNATQVEIRNAYDKLTNRWNPKNNDHIGANRKFLDINNAYQVLSDDETRRRYNNSIDNREIFKHSFDDPFDVYEEFQKMKKKVEDQFKDKLEDVLCRVDYKNIKYKSRLIINKELVIINDRPFEKIMEMDDRGVVYITYIHENGMRQSIMSDEYLDGILKIEKNTLI